MGADILPSSPISPFGTLTIRQIRTSRMKPMKNLTIETGIYKQPRPSLERVFCSFTGLDADEHDLTFHGGRDKAVHQYFPGHYQKWRDEYRPEGKDGGFEIGAFGENLIVEEEGGSGRGMNEENVCIGDIYRVGEEGVLLQISLPRQPCFKLNHRFNIKNFAPQTYKKSRTGWYYRVLKEGSIGVGDRMELVDRKHPEWCIQRIQEYLHRDGKNDLAMLRILLDIEEFGNECKKAFTRGIESLMKAQEGKIKTKWRTFEVVEKKAETPRIKSFILQSVEDKAEGGKIDLGSFARLKLPNGLERSYSVVGGTTNRFQLGIALDDHSRGGSAYLHKVINQGDHLEIGKITSGVPFASSASSHTFIVGGIGITAFLDQVEVYAQINYNYEFHYAVRSAEELPFRDKLEKMGSRLVLYDGSKGERMDIPSLLEHRTWNTFIYVCGPERMIAAVQEAAARFSVTPDEIHYEAFATNTSGPPFEVELQTSKSVLKVGEEQTLLEVLREAGLDIDSSCEVGNCGTCKVNVCQGKVEHRGSALSEEEKGEGAMLSCVSRGVGRIVLDL